MKRKYQALQLISLCFMVGSCQSNTGASLESYTVVRGDFIDSITETGELMAVNSQRITAPSISWRFGGLKITKIIEDGKQVEAGELLIEFDKAEVAKGIDDAKAELEIAEAELRKTHATQASQIEGLQADFEKTSLQHRISQLNLEKATFESDIRRKEIELELEKAGIALEKAKLEIESQKSINREEISKQNLRVSQVQTKMEEAKATFEKLSVSAPSPGIAVIEKSMMTRSKYQVDDQVWPGWPMIGLPDLSAMQAIVQINEVDIAKIDTMQKSNIRLDAFPETVFHGKVSDIAALARNKEKDSKVKVFDITILLDESNEKLMPGMTVSCEIILNQIPDTLFIPLEALFNVAGGNIVYLKNGNDFEPHSITIGPENDDYVVIAGGLKEGDQIALMNPFLNQTTNYAKESNSK